MITLDELLNRTEGRGQVEDHEHDLEDREFNIEGHRVSGKTCRVCGERFFLLQDLLPLEAEIRKRETGTEALKVEDAFLLLAATYPEVEVPGKIVAQKEMFLLEKAFAPKFGLNVEPMGFVPYRYGPYSRRLNESIQSLKERGLIEERPLPGREGKAFALTDEGKEVAEEKKGKVSSSVWRSLRRHRRGWDELGSQGLLRLVYRDFSPFASASEIKEDVERGPDED